MNFGLSVARIAVAVVAAAAGGSSANASSCDGITPYGAPTAASATVVVCEQGGGQPFFVTDYDRDKVAPRWVEYELTHEQMVEVGNSTITRKHDGIPFAADKALNAGNFTSPTDDDFDGIQAKGYDRGHLLDADAMKWSLDAYHSTFVVSNIALQASAFNEHLWQKVEILERGWACDHGPIYAVTGVNFATTAGKTFHSTKHDLTMTVPTHYWKAIYTPADGGHFIGIIFRNLASSGPLNERAVHSLLDMESLTGLKLFPNLPLAQRQKLNSMQPDLSFWSLGYKSSYKCQ